LTAARIAVVLAVVASAAHAETFEARWRRIMIRPPDPGVASWYEDRLASTGEHLHPWDRNPERFTCASPEEPVGTRLRVCHGDRCLVCRVADYGPRPRLQRRVDLTPAGFEALGFRLADGLGVVTFDRE
jgi:rare lipoprotein A (peptidoglycan hydrolase)